MHKGCTREHTTFIIAFVSAERYSWYQDSISACPPQRFRQVKKMFKAAPPLSDPSPTSPSPTGPLDSPIRVQLSPDCALLRPFGALSSPALAAKRPRQHFPPEDTLESSPTAAPF